MKQRLLNKRFLSFILLFSLLLGSLLVTIFLALTAPLHPGDFFYPVQNAGEQVELALMQEEQAQAALSLTLADRRLASLAQSASPTKMQAAITALNSALETAVQHLNALPPEVQPTEHAQFNALLQRTEIVLAALEADEAGQLAALANRVQNWQEADSLAEVAAQLPLRVPAPSLSAAALVPFLTSDVDHTAFPLTAGHAYVACESCHTNGTYANTPTNCADCHSLQPADQTTADLLFVSNHELWQVYPKHFTGDCETCHNTSSWAPFTFDHGGVIECQSCHEEDLPLRIEIGRASCRERV